MKHGEPCLFLVAVLMGLSSDYDPAGLRGPECILRTPKSAESTEYKSSSFFIIISPMIRIQSEDHLSFLFYE